MQLHHVFEVLYIGRLSKLDEDYVLDTLVSYTICLTVVERGTCDQVGGYCLLMWLGEKNLIRNHTVPFSQKDCDRS